MTTKIMASLKKYDPVMHKWMGECIVIEAGLAIDATTLKTTI